MRLLSRKYKAFSLVEVTVVIGILIAVFSIAIPYMINDPTESRVQFEMSNLVSHVFEHQQYAFTHRNGSDYGVKFNTGSYVLFEGDTYATATDTLTIDLPSDITISDVSMSDTGTEVQFDQGEFKPNQYGTLKMSKDGVEYRMTINREGLVYRERL